MYPIVIRITYEPPPGQYARRLPAITKDVLREAAEYWHSDILPEHFQPGAAEKYGYAPRTQAHKRRKRQKHREHLPLVFTGAGREDILSPPYIQVSPTRTTMTLAAPTYQEQQALIVRMGKNASQMLREMGGKETAVLTGG
jgi:hypothetical protein